MGCTSNKEELLQNRFKQISFEKKLNQNDLAKNNFKEDFVNILSFRMNFQEGPNVHELLSSEAFCFPAKTRAPLLGSLK